MKKAVLSLFLAGVFALCCACAGSAPEPASTPAAPSAEPTPEIIKSAEPTPKSDEDDSDIVKPYPAATPEEAVQFLVQMPPRAFGLAEPFDDYEVRYVDPDLVQQPRLEGVDTYTMELEVTYPDNVEVLSLCIRTDLGAIYHYDDESGSYHEITPYDYYCPQESPGGDNGGAQASTRGDNSGAQASPKSNDAPKKSSENRDEGPKGYPEGGESAAILHLMRYSKEELNLPDELREYVVRVDGETEVNGIRCYDIGVYADLGERMELMNTYWVAFDNSVVFATDLQTGGYRELPVK